MSILDLPAESFDVPEIKKPPAPSPFIPGTKMQWVWDATSLGWLKKCPRLYEYQMIRGFRGRKSFHLYFGIEFHQAMHDYENCKAAGLDHDQAELETIAKLLTRTFNWDSESPTKNRETLVRSVIWCLEAYKEDNAKTVILANGKPAIELSFKVSTDIEIRYKGNVVPGFEGQFNEKTYMAAGHLDRLCQFIGDYYVADRKTTDKTVGTYYFEQYNPDNQMSFYTTFAQIVYEIPLKGVIIDAVQTAVGFTRPERGMTMRTPDQINEWMHDLEFWLRMAEAYAAAEYWPMNDAACYGCRFREVCSKSPSVRESYLQTNFDVDRWNPLAER
jgi:PD-(D/E)XK nuclease superfamily protein